MLLPTSPETIVAVVVVAMNGRAWLPELLASLTAQTRQPDVVVAVDNASNDGTRELLIASLGADQVIASERDLGFPAAVNAGVDAVPEADLVLLLHDDVVLDDDVVERLVAAVVADPRLAVVGPKVVDHGNPRRLRSVGLTIDRFGLVHDGLEDKEIDQGQFIEPRQHLAVTSAAMLVRRDVYNSLGGFDGRFELFRDDLDFCWRVWLAGWEVRVIPTASVLHRRAAASHARHGQIAFKGPHFFKERNTLATIIKNVAGWRMPLAVLVFVLVAAVRSLWFVLTRRFSEAWLTVQAWGWNLTHLRGTWRRRRKAAATRRRTHAQLSHLFAPLGPRLRNLVAIAVDQVTGGDLRVRQQAERELKSATGLRARLARSVRHRPVLTVGLGIVVLGALVSLPVLVTGPIRLGHLQPFPASGLVPIRDYLSSWHDAGAAGTSLAPSPAQFLLGLLQVLSFGNEWVASRLLLLGSVVAAWLLALRAAAPLVQSRGARVAAATLYALSPPAIAAVRAGRVGAIVTVMVVPAAATALYLVVARSAGRASAWRGAAAAILVLAIGIAFEPGLVVPAAVLLWILGMVVAMRRDTPGDRRGAWTRLLVVVVGVVAVLFPWSLGLVEPGRWWPTSILPADGASSPLWQWLLQAPDQVGFHGLVAGIGMVAAGVLGLLAVSRRRPVAAATLGAVVVGASVVAYLVDQQGTDGLLWPGTVLLLAAGALAALFGMGVQVLGRALEERSFGWRQLALVTMLVTMLAGVGGIAVDVTRDGWELGRGEVPLPSFVATSARQDDHRVLTIVDHGATVAWDLVGSGGETMADFGVAFSSELRDTLDVVVESVIAQTDPGSTGRLGLLNIRYIVVPAIGASDMLREGLDRQFHLESRPVASGLVYELVNDTPPVGITQPAVASAIETFGALPDHAVITPLTREPDETWRTRTGGQPGTVLVSVVEAGGWEGSASGQPLTAEVTAGLVAFQVPADSLIEVAPGGQAERTSALIVELIALLFTVSLLLRPPRSDLEEDP